MFVGRQTAVCVWLHCTVKYLEPVYIGSSCLYLLKRALDPESENTAGFKSLSYYLSVEWLQVIYIIDLSLRFLISKIRLLLVPILEVCCEN
jgi:hypothetical protein